MTAKHQPLNTKLFLKIGNYNQIADNTIRELILQLVHQTHDTA